MAENPILQAMREQIEKIRRKTTADMEALQKKHDEDLQELRRGNKRLRNAMETQGMQTERNLEHEATNAQTQRSTPMPSESHQTQSRSRVDKQCSSHFRHQTNVGTRSHPFVDGIMETHIPTRWKTLNLNRYDGTTHSDEHIDAYVTQVNLFTNDDAILCRIFPTSLKGDALSWYTRLLPRSLDCFKTLVQRFKDQHATSRPHHMISVALVNLRQAEDEPLRKFMEIFISISVKIRDLNPDVALHSMLTALKPGPFVDSLCLTPTPLQGWMTCGGELRVTFKWRKYPLFGIKFELIQAENEKGVAAVAKTYSKQYKTRNSSKASSGPRYDLYTPLNTNRARILDEAFHAELLSLPSPGRTPDLADKMKQCRYHQNYGHTIEQCWTLRDKIEELI